MDKDKVIVKAIQFEQGDITFWLCALKYQYLAQITYVARRGESQEEGAIQRMLNKKRIDNIRDYILSGGMFPNNIVLNWVSDDTFSFDRNNLHFTLGNRVAQIIDGQHRVEGIKEALKEKPEISSLEIPTVFTQKLDTSKCAEIFLSINTEQQPVPKSLVYDLFRELQVSKRDFSTARATDIAIALNGEEHSPYQGYIKFPNTKRMRGGIQLSTVVTSLKKLVKEEGEFPKVGVTNLDNQIRVLISYFSVYQDAYALNWHKTTTNPFLFASGFSAALELLNDTLLRRCRSEKSFKKEKFATFLKLGKDNLIHPSLVKNLSGEAAKQKIKEQLKLLVIDRTNNDEIEY